MIIGPKEKMLAEAVCPNCNAPSNYLRAKYTQQMTVQTLVKFPQKEAVPPEDLVLEPVYDEHAKTGWDGRADVGKTQAIFTGVTCLSCNHSFAAAKVRLVAVSEKFLVEAAIEPTAASWKAAATLIRHFALTDSVESSKKFRNRLTSKTFGRITLPNRVLFELSSIEKEKDKVTRIARLETLRNRLLKYLDYHTNRKEEHDRSDSGTHVHKRVL